MDMPSGRVIGLLHPGEMGASVGRCLTEAGHVVLWASQGRGPETAARARAAGLQDVGTAEEMAGRAEIILSICPPHAALDMAWAVQGFGGLFVDANAISPATAREVAAMVEDCGAGYVDGGIIGPPPAKPGSTRLYLSGPRAGPVRELFDGTPLDARVIDGGNWSASAVKMAYAAWTKGTAALLLATRALARAEGVQDALLAEWALSQPGLADRCRGAAVSATAKGWRWVAEMEEIAAAMADAGLPDGFHQGAADIFRRVPRGGRADARGEGADARGGAADARRESADPHAWPADRDDHVLDAVLAALAPALTDDLSPAPD
jgi:3-hydroxyisobutyrate dehydrogenase-like beta-hydroxyacid dehydrogenase